MILSCAWRTSHIFLKLSCIDFSQQVFSITGNTHKRSYNLNVTCSCFQASREDEKFQHCSSAVRLQIVLVSSKQATLNLPNITGRIWFVGRLQKHSSIIIDCIVEQQTLLHNKCKTIFCSQPNLKHLREDVRKNVESILHPVEQFLKLLGGLEICQASWQKLMSTQS